MREIVMESISGTFLKVVEQLTFMFGEPQEKVAMPTAGTKFTRASLAFSGDLVGTLHVVVDSEIVVEIAANILGLDVEDVDAKTMPVDALGEMLNVVCGHVIMAVVGHEADFKLDSPEISTVDDAFIGEIKRSDDYLGYLLDESPAFLGLTTES